jgi:hypothetical protein
MVKTALMAGTARSDSAPVATGKHSMRFGSLDISVCQIDGWLRGAVKSMLNCGIAQPPVADPAPPEGNSATTYRQNDDGEK